MPRAQKACVMNTGNGSFEIFLAEQARGVGGAA
jgi:hypothetical protein